MTDLEALKKKKKAILRQWHMAEEHRRWNLADSLLADAEAVQRQIDELEGGQS